MTTAKLDATNGLMLDLSTGHLPKHTAEALGVWREGENGLTIAQAAPMWRKAVYTPHPGGYGWIFWPQDPHEWRELHPELATIIDFATENNYRLVQFDCEAQRDSRWPTFEW